MGKARRGTTKQQGTSRPAGRAGQRTRSKTVKKVVARSARSPYPERKGNGSSKVYVMLTLSTEAASKLDAYRSKAGMRRSAFIEKLILCLDEPRLSVPGTVDVLALDTATVTVR